jgi:hypothetical protein
LFEPFAQHCVETSTRYIVVPKGFGLTPPQANVGDGGGLKYENDDDDDDDDDGGGNYNASTSKKSTEADYDVSDTDAWG